LAIYRGTVVDFDAGAHTATIRLDGSAAEVLAAVATSHAIPSAEMTPGRKVLLDTGDHNHPADFVVTAVFGA
jgi:hypothetical protein